MWSLPRLPVFFSVLTLWAGLASGCTQAPEAEPLTQAETPTQPEPAVPASATPAPMTRTLGVLGKGTSYASPWVDLRGPEEGPSILIEAGIHGDEIAGTYALDALLVRLQIHKGRVVVFSRMNKPAVDKQVRLINLDLNLIFPGKAKGEPYEHRLAYEIYNWVGALDVDTVLTLHESRYLHDGSTPRTFGQTIVYGVKPMPPLLTRVLDQLNASLDDPRHKFWPNYFPIATSSTEQFVENFGVQGFCAETWRGFSMDTRVTLQKELILAFLDQTGIKYSLTPEPPSAKLVR